MAFRSFDSERTWWRLFQKRDIYLFIMVTTTTWLTYTKYMCHKWPGMWDTCHNHNLVVSLFVTYHWSCNKTNANGITSGAGPAYPFGAHEFNPSFSGVRLFSTLSFCIVFCRQFVCPFSFEHCLVCPFSIDGFWVTLWDLFKLFFNCFCFYNYGVLSLWFTRRVWRYQRSNQNPCIKEEQTPQWPDFIHTTSFPFRRFIAISRVHA